MVRWANAQPIPLPIHLGEFGAYHYAPHISRILWTRTVRKTCENYGINWAYYWELAQGFGFWDATTSTYRHPEIRDALVVN